MNTWKRPSQSFIWVGISFWPSENSFVWDDDGSQLADEVKSKWALGEPESGHDHDHDRHGGHCVVLSDDGEMWDIDCDGNHGTYPFVCQKRLKPLPRGTSRHQH